MCRNCPSAKIRIRICEKCKLTRAPAPATGPFVCISCDSTTPWNLEHSVDAWFFIRFLRGEVKEEDLEPRLQVSGLIRTEDLP